MKRKQEDFSLLAPKSDGRSLRDVEDDMQFKRDKKDALINEKDRLNKELMKLNENITRARNDVTRKEENLKDLETKFQKGQEAEKRKIELNEIVRTGNDEIRKLQEKIRPLQ